MPRWKNGEIIEITEITNQLRTIVLKIAQEDVAQFIPGQFIVLDLPVGVKRLDRWRSYSIANNPAEEGVIELCIVKVPEGKATTYLFEEIGIGTQLIYKGPEGNFCLPNQIDTDLLMICTGTGVAPFRSMIKDIYSNNRTRHSVHLIYGTRRKEGILYKEEFEELKKANKLFQYSIALSREDYKGYRGYVHGIYDQIPLEKLKESKIFLCGWQNMIDEAVNSLTNERGIKRENIYFELYG